MTKQTVLSALFAVSLTGIAFICLLYPRWVQDIARRAVETGPTARSQKLVEFVSSETYLWSVRGVGAIALLMSTILFLAIIKR